MGLFTKTLTRSEVNKIYMKTELDVFIEPGKSYAYYGSGVSSDCLKVLFQCGMTVAPTSRKPAL